MKKDTIYVDLDDEITTITDKVQSSKEKVVALVLPKHCAVLQSAVNMKILNKIAADNGKRVVLVTSESSLLPLAGAAGLFVAKSLQSQPYLPDVAGGEEPITTIDEKDDNTEVDMSKSVGELAVAAGMADESLPDDDEAPIELGQESIEEEVGDKKASQKGDKKLRVPNFEKFRLWLVIVIVLIFGLIGGGIYAAKAMPKATVTVITQNQTVAVSLTATASLTAKTLDLENKIVPGEVKTVDQAVTRKFQATGEANIGNKATGKVIFYNCSKEDKLGDIEQTVASGTGISNGGFTFITQASVTVQPSGFNGDTCKYDKPSAEVDVTAQSGGDSYNLSPRDYSVSGWGSMTATDGDGMGGGTNNIVTAVSQSDCDTAKNALLETKTDDYKNQLSAQLSTAGLLPLRETFTATPGEVTCSPAVGAQASESTASLTLKMTMTGANITALDQLVKAEVIKQDNQQSIFDTGVRSAITSVKEKQASGDVVFTLQANAQTGIQQDSQAIAKLIVGKKYGESLSIIRSQSGVSDVRIKYSPFFVTITPNKLERISVNFTNQ